MLGKMISHIDARYRCSLLPCKCTIFLDVITKMMLAMMWTTCPQMAYIMQQRQPLIREYDRDTVYYFETGETMRVLQKGREAQMEIHFDGELPQFQHLV